jgi:hypothetical protein
MAFIEIYIANIALTYRTPFRSSIHAKGKFLSIFQRTVAAPVVSLSTSPAFLFPVCLQGKIILKNYKNILGNMPLLRQNG